jgi:transcriptional regulator with XRE-family HTH domain
LRRRKTRCSGDHGSSVLRVREANEGWAEFVGRLISNRYGGKQSALADAVGVSPSTVTRWLDGATPAIPQLRAISEETGFGMAELLTAAGALDGAAAATPSVSPDVVADVAEAIRRDTELLARTCSTSTSCSAAFPRRQCRCGGVVRQDAGPRPRPATTSRCAP